MRKRQIVLWILGCFCLILTGIQLIPWEDVRAFTSGVVVGKSTTNAAMIYPFQGKSFHTGQTWTIGSFRASRDLLAVTYQEGAFWARDSAGTAFTTVDGERWEAKIPENLPDFPGVAFGKDKYVAVGEQGKVFVSLDGTHWQEKASGVTSDLLGVAFGNGRFVAVGRGGVILSSLDGATWEVKDSGVSNDLHGVAFGSGRFVAVGEGGVVLTSSESGWYFVFYSEGRKEEVLVFLKLNRYSS